MTYKPYDTIKASGISKGYLNGSGVSIPKGTPVRVKSDGNIDFVNVSVEAEVLAIIGCMNDVTANNISGGVVSSGSVENIGGSFNVSESIWLSKSGSLTNIRPEVGVGGFVSGDFVVRVGTIAKNNTFPLQKDLVLELTLVGQLVD